eukprot:2898740-Rhodomonas_salina.1
MGRSKAGRAIQIARHRSESMIGFTDKFPIQVPPILSQRYLFDIMAAHLDCLVQFDDMALLRATVSVGPRRSKTTKTGQTRNTNKTANTTNTINTTETIETIRTMKTTKTIKRQQKKRQSKDSQKTIKRQPEDN